LGDPAAQIGLIFAPLSSFCLFSSQSAKIDFYFVLNILLIDISLVPSQTWNLESPNWNSRQRTLLKTKYFSAVQKFLKHLEEAKYSFKPFRRNV
jgi:hypothetical protein